MKILQLNLFDDPAEGGGAEVDTLEPAQGLPGGGA